MKKYISFLLAITIIFSCFNVYAQEIKPANVKVLLNEQELTFEQEPVIVNDRTLVPLRAIFEALGAEVEWDGKTRTVTATRDHDIVKLTIDDLMAFKNEEAITLDAPPIIVEGHTMVPARFIAESFGLEVGWNGNSRIITIETNAQSAKLSNEQLINPPPPVGELSVHYIDVDQGDSTLLLGSDFTILIDTGRHDRNDVVPYLKSVGITEIDLVVGTHPHSDHIGQLEKVINEFPVKEVWLDGNSHTSNTFERLIDAILESGASYHEPRAGENFTIGSAFIEVIHPKELTGNLNNDSVSMRVAYGDISFLFTGDTEKESEQEILNRSHNIQAQIFQLGHHGSSTSNNQPFLDSVKPEIAIYSAGKDNSYGHPHDEIIDRLKAMDIPVYGTDVHGNIIVTTDGKTYDIKTKKSGNVAATPTPVVVPEQSNTEPKAKEEPALPASSGCGPSHVNINTASLEEIKKIKHIDDERGQELISLRPFSSLDSLTRINGIAAGRLKDIKGEGIACVD